MVFVSVALRSEAEPIIENFQLKLEDTKNRFSIYSSDRIKLIITGVGKINSAIGTAIL
ncbi:MAG: nucleoside phosphorylase, partial [Leptospiraceae bacterium]|nr:nucleoside phosphorylase [Leptospiraceae bacterium]